MLFYVVAAAMFLLGLGLTLFAFVSAHKTPLPQMPGIVYLWWPGLVLIGLSVGVATLPGVLLLRECGAVCDVLDGQPVTHPAAKDVVASYDGCVRNGLEGVRREAVEKNKKTGATSPIDVNAAVKEAEHGVRELCAEMALSSCVATCTDPPRADAGAH